MIKVAYDKTYTCFVQKFIEHIEEMLRCIPSFGRLLTSEFYMPTFRNTLFHLHGQCVSCSHHL